MRPDRKQRTTRRTARTARNVRAGPAGDDAPSLAEQAYAAIKERILSLELRPGQFLNEQTICGLVGLGRTPVHQAVHRLSREGLLDIIPRKGLIVRPDSMNEILDVIEARSAVEPNIAALAAERITPAQIEQLRAVLAESGALVDRRDRQHFMRLDRAFHAAIAAASGNPILADVIRPLHERAGRLWHLQLMQSNDIEITQREHAAILAAIMRADRSAAAAAMQEHLASLRRRRITGDGS